MPKDQPLTSYRATSRTVSTLAPAVGRQLHDAVGIKRPDSLTIQSTKKIMSGAEDLIQFIKYALAGGVATVVQIVLFHLSAWKLFPALQPNDHAVRFFKLSLHPINDFHRARNSMISNVLAFLVANLVAYITNILWVFEAGRHSFIIEILLFYAVSGISVCIGTSLMGVLIKRYRVLTTYAFVTNIVSAVLINYAARKFFIFAG